MRHRRERIELPTGASFRVIEWTRDVEEVEVVKEDGRWIPSQEEGTHWHYHPEMELTWFSRGEGLRFIGDHIGPFTAGDLVLVGRRLPHHWQVRGASAGLSVRWHYPDGHPLWAIPELQPLVDLFAAAQYGLHFPPATAGRIAERMMGMAGLTSGPERFAALLMIFGDLAASLAEVQELSCRSFTPPPEDSPHHNAIRDAIGYLLKFFRKPVALEKMLEVTRMTRPTFCRQFRLHTGHSFSEFLNRVRLHAACRDLKSGSKPVIDIALDSGISQVSFFNRLFLREMGCTPSQYRRTGEARVQMDFRRA